MRVFPAIRAFVGGASGRSVIVGVVALDLVVGALIGFALWSSYNQYVDRARTNATNLDNTIEQYLSSTIDRIDHELFDAVRETERQLRFGGVDKEALARFVIEGGSHIPIVANTRIIDANGDFVSGVRTVSSAKLPNIADTEHFQHVRIEPGLVISPPFTSRLDGLWVIALSRRIDNPDGSFYGIATSLLLLDTVTEFFSRIDVGKNGGISLRGPDMAIIARHPDPGGRFRGNRTLSPELQAMLDQGMTAGTYYSGTTWDGSARVVAFTRIGPYPLNIAVGLSPNDFLGPWRAQTLQFGVFYLVFLLGSAGWARMTFRLHRERVAAEAEARHTLERQVSEATASLHEALQAAWVARDAALSASRAKSEFLANMSHELRTPLNAILGYVQLLDRERGLNERQSARLGTIGQAALHLLVLIDDLLDLSKIEARRFELSPTPVALPDFLQGIADIVRVKAEEEGLRLTVDLAPDLPPWVAADDSRLRQILLNLLGNAVKFTDAGEIVFRAWRGEGEALHFSVADTGIGMSPEQLQRLFQPFERVGDTKQRRPGTGLGLAISRQLARLMGGDIQVESRSGEGSRFTLDLPLPVTATPALATETRPDIIGYEGPRRTVLVVDDVEANRRLLAEMLGEIGFAVTGVADGNEALARIDGIEPDLVIVDTVMPGLDGREVIRALRHRADFDALPIIVVSANATAEEAAQAMTAGADAFVSKPIDRLVLLNHIGDVLGLRWIREMAAAS